MVFRWLAVLSILIAPGEVGRLQAQEATEPSVVAPTPEQKRLYRQAHQAYLDERHADAVELLQAALDLGEINLFYLSLGRSLFHLERCEEAEEAYSRALTAPAIANPPPALFKDKVKEYWGDLAASCPGTLVLDCNLGGTRVVIGETTYMCQESPLQLKPGTYQIRTEHQQELVTVIGMQETRITIEGASMSTRSWAWVAGGAGIAVVAASALGEQLVLRETLADNRANPSSEVIQERANRQQALFLSSYVIGAGLLVTGAIFYGLSDDPEANADPLGNAQPWLDPQSVGLTWSRRW